MNRPRRKDLQNYRGTDPQKLAAFKTVLVRVTVFPLLRRNCFCVKVMTKKKAALHSKRFGDNSMKRVEGAASNQPGHLTDKQRNRERSAEEKAARKNHFKELRRTEGGIPSRPLLGKRTVLLSHHTRLTTEFTDFATDTVLGRGRYFILAHNPTFLVMLWRDFFDINYVFWPTDVYPNIAFVAASLFIQKYFCIPTFDIRKKGINVIQLRAKCVQYLSSLEWCREVVRIFGAAILPQHTITIDGVRTPIHKVPRSAIRASMVSFLNGSNGEFTGLDDVNGTSDPWVINMSNQNIYRAFLSNGVEYINLLVFLFIIAPVSVGNEKFLDAFIEWMYPNGSSCGRNSIAFLVSEVYALYGVFFRDKNMSVFCMMYEGWMRCKNLFLLRSFYHHRKKSSDQRFILFHNWFLRLFTVYTEVFGRVALSNSGAEALLTDVDDDDDLLNSNICGGMDNPQDDIEAPPDRVAQGVIQRPGRGAGRGRGGRGRGDGNGGRVADLRRPEGQPDNHPRNHEVPPDRAARPAMWWEQDRKRLEEEFVSVNEIPNKTLWSISELTEDMPGFLMNCYGSPFCGLTAIDLACRVKPKCDVYCNLAKYKNSATVIGKLSYIQQWAAYRGVNIEVCVPLYDYVNDQASFTIKSRKEHNPNWEWVRLVLKRRDGTLCNRADTDNPAFVGHYWLLTHCVADTPNVTLQELGDGGLSDRKKLWAFLLNYGVVMVIVVLITVFTDILRVKDRLGMLAFIETTLTSYTLACAVLLYWCFKSLRVRIRYSTSVLYGGNLGIFRNTDNKDVRSLRDRLDPFAHQDYYLRAVRLEEYLVLGFMTWVNTGGVKIISIGRANQAIKEAQCLPIGDREKCLVSVMRSGICNTNDSLANIYLDTIGYVKDWIDCCDSLSSASYENKIVAFNASGATSYIPSLNRVEYNQQVGIAGGDNNFVKSLKEPTEKDFIRKVVAYAPIGALHTDLGTLGPGNLCTSDFYSNISSFVGRSMSNEVTHSDLMAEFVEFSKEFLDWYVDRTDVSDIVEDDDPSDYFRLKYQGKKTASYIESILSNFRDYKLGFKVPRKFFRFGCFTKFEDSSKIVGGVSRVRPRLIMTMSDLFLVSTCQFLKVVDAWCHGPFKRFQVKNLTPEEFISKIQDASDGRHIVTDYSSFEASISFVVRDIENYVFERLMDKAGLHKTAKQWSGVMSSLGPRTMYNKAGVFKIQSRCSGDFHTSAGNGIVNVCLNAFSCYKKFGYIPDNFKMIAEGDDGLIDPSLISIDVINQLGFKFSSELEGTHSGDVDFLRRRWMMDTCFINIGRALKSAFWVKSQSVLSKKKQMGILRAMALSLHIMSPGHPVLFEVVNRIGKLTRGYSTPFKGIEKYFDHRFSATSNIFDFSKFPKTVECNEFMRSYIVDGAKGFPPIPMGIQLEIERRIKNDPIIYIGTLLDDYDDILGAKKAQQWKDDRAYPLSVELLEVLDILSRFKVSLPRNRYSSR